MHNHLTSTHSSPTPIHNDPITPNILGVSPYLIILIAYPINTVEKPTIVTFPDFLLINTLARHILEPIDMAAPTVKNT